MAEELRERVCGVIEGVTHSTAMDFGRCQVTEYCMREGVEGGRRNGEWGMGNGEWGMWSVEWERKGEEERWQEGREK